MSSLMRVAFFEVRVYMVCLDPAVVLSRYGIESIASCLLGVSSPDVPVELFSWYPIVFQLVCTSSFIPLLLQSFGAWGFV